MKLTKSKLVQTCISLGFLSLGLAFVGCNGEEGTQTVAPAASGQRGETCDARNNCASGLACIQGVCAQNQFEVSPQSKECVLHECAETADCCGGKPSTAPAKCANVVSICDTPTIPGCTSDFLSCTSSAECDGGVCGLGICSYTSTSCDDANPCAQDTCVTGTCSISSVSCPNGQSDCATNTCLSRECSCENPVHDPFDPICTDPDCTDVCTVICQDSLCVEDETCETDTDCIGSFTGPVCLEGSCVGCATDDDCDTENDFACNANHQCEKPCTKNEECPTFSECQKGDCAVVGCKSDLECVLWFGNVGSGDNDPRQGKCMAVAGSTVKQCAIPCEVDTECGESSVCEDGVCTLLGCATDADCRADHPELQGQVPTEARPWVTTTTCEAPATE